MPGSCSFTSRDRRKFDRDDGTEGDRLHALPILSLDRRIRNPSDTHRPALVMGITGTALAPAGVVFRRFTRLAFCLFLLTTTSLQAQSRVVELNEEGWKLIQAGDATRAARVFAEALDAQPDHPVLLFGAGAAAHLQGRAKEASARLRRSLEIAPDLTPASILLGQIEYSNGNVGQAISIYEKALAHAPNDPCLTSRLSAWRADAEASRGFVERRVDRFRVMFQGHADTALAARATDILESAFWRIGKSLGAYPSDPVIVMLYTKQQFRDITMAPEWSGGVYDGRIRVPAAGAAQSPQLFERVLVHELTHAMIASLTPRGVPAWLHEGLAQHFEGDDPAAARRRLKAVGVVIPLRHLEAGFTRLSAEQAMVAYDESLVVVDAILKRGRVDWNGLFGALGSSSRTEYTFDNFGLRYSELEGEIERAIASTVASRSR
jgi:tetratricopeptide (TPR) repeat protein